MACSLSADVNGLTGDCSNSSVGAFELLIQSTSPSVSFQMIYPYTATSVVGSATTYSYPFFIYNYTITGLSAGTYTYYLFDACPTQTGPSSVYISSGTCVSILSIQNTTCGEFNGAIQVATNTIYNTLLPSFYLYETTYGFETQIQTLNGNAIFTNLEAGTYYVIAEDGAGCTGKSESCIIKSSTTLDFGFYVINDSNCGINTGSIYITGITGSPPYSYLWSNGENTNYISGLTEGVYSVIITDSNGCTITKSTTIFSVPSLSVTNLIGTPPSCFSGDGEITVYVSGGTAPYYYQGSNGDVAITFSQNHTFTGLTSGAFSVQVTDAGLCNANGSIVLQTPNSFYVVSINTTNSTCNNNSGIVDVSLAGGSGFYTVTLIDSSGNTQTNSSVGSSTSFTTLSSGTYTLQITNGGPCVYTQSITINNTNLFTLTTSSTGTTCNNDNGSVMLSITSGGTPPYLYQIGSQSDSSSNLSYTFYNLAGGNYTASVTDSNFCQQNSQFTITSSNNVDFNLSVISPTIGPNGMIDAFITSGEPPFTLNWSSNIPSGQTGVTITGLSAGTYSLTITDNNNCVKTRSVSMFGYNLVTSYQVLNLCEKDSAFTGSLGRRGPQQMLVEGFHDLTSGDTGCILNQAIYEIVVSGNSIVTTNTFYTGNTLVDFPSDNEYFDGLQQTLLQYDGIQNVDVNPLNNQIIINTICNPPVSLIDLELSVSLKIYYDISCISCSP